MGKRGPKPKDAKLLHSWRKKLRADAPMTAGKLKKPSNLKGNAKKKWLEITSQLEQMGISGAADSTALTRYCELWSWYRENIKFIKKYGQTDTLTNKNGDDYIVARPEVNTALKFAVLFAKLEDCFGLTPSARAGLKINGKSPEETPLEKLLIRQKGIRRVS